MSIILRATITDLSVALRPSNDCLKRKERMVSIRHLKTNKLVSLAPTFDTDQVKVSGSSKSFVSYGIEIYI